LGKWLAAKHAALLPPWPSKTPQKINLGEKDWCEQLQNMLNALQTSGYRGVLSKSNKMTSMSSIVARMPRSADTATVTFTTEDEPSPAAANTDSYTSCVSNKPSDIQQQLLLNHRFSLSWQWIVLEAFVSWYPFAKQEPTTQPHFLSFLHHRTCPSTQPYSAIDSGKSM
jgi:hypothetical protein